MGSERSYEAQERYKVEAAATPAQEQAITDMDDLLFRESVAVLYDPSSWIVQYLKPSGRKRSSSFRAMKMKTIQSIFEVNEERKMARMIRVLHSIRDLLKHQGVTVEVPIDVTKQSQLAKTILEEVSTKKIENTLNEFYFQLHLWSMNYQDMWQATRLGRHTKTAVLKSSLLYKDETALYHVLCPTMPRRAAIGLVQARMYTLVEPNAQWSLADIISDLVIDIRKAGIDVQWPIDQTEILQLCQTLIYGFTYERLVQEATNISSDLETLTNFVDETIQQATNDGDELMSVGTIITRDDQSVQGSVCSDKSWTSQLYSKQAQQLATLEQKQSITAAMLTEILSLVKNQSNMGGSQNMAGTGNQSMKMVNEKLMASGIKQNDGCIPAWNMNSSSVNGKPEPTSRAKSVHFTDPSLKGGFMDGLSKNVGTIPISTGNVHSLPSHLASPPTPNQYNNMATVSPVNNGIDPVGSIYRPVYENSGDTGYVHPTNITSGLANPPTGQWGQHQPPDHSKFDIHSIMEPTSNGMITNGPAVANVSLNPLVDRFDGASYGAYGQNMNHQHSSSGQRGRSTRDYPREPIPRFSASKGTYADGFNFLHILAKHCEYFQWSTVQWQKELRGHFCDETWMWFCGLAKDSQNDFRQFALLFKKRWMDDPCPDSLQYNYARQKDHESIDTFFTRLCYYARNAGIDVRQQWNAVLNHFQLCLTADNYTRIGEMRFDTYDSFTMYLANRRTRQHIAPMYKGRPSVFGRNPSKGHNSNTNESKSNHTAFSMASDQMSEASTDENDWDVTSYASTYAISKEDLAECYALNINPRNAQKEQCRECGRNHFKKDGICWANLVCSICELKGHPSERCFKLCKNDFCPSKTVPHNKDKCPASDSAALQQNYQTLLAAFKAKGLTPPELMPLKE